MKKIFMSIVLTGLLGMYANARQNQSGIYLNFDDFKNNKLSYAGNTTSGTNKIRFHEFSGKDIITVKHNGVKSTLFKDKVYAYQRNNGEVVRTWGRIPYTLNEQGNIWIYYRDVNVSRGKGIQMERKYFYSETGTSAIIPLTVNNLKHSFSDKYLFHNFLDAQFRSDSELSLYDGFARKFKVNQLLETTVAPLVKK